MFTPRLTNNDVVLTPLVTDDEAIAKYTQWVNDENIAHWVDKSCSVITIDEEKKWATTPNGEMRFSIFVKKSSLSVDTTNYFYEEAHEQMVMVGTCSITLSRCNTNATLGILIGEKFARGHGVGTTVINMLTEYAFNMLRVHRCHLLMVAENENALRCYIKAGYKVCGTEHEAFWYNGHYADVNHLEYIFDESGLKEKINK